MAYEYIPWFGISWSVFVRHKQTVKPIAAKLKLKQIVANTDVWYDTQRRHLSR